MSYWLSRLGVVWVKHLPTFVSVEPANICQLKCPQCPVGIDKGERLKVKGERFMSPEVFERVLTEVAPTAWVMQFYFQGEPLLNKHLPQMIAQAHQTGLYTIVSTNAQALTEELAKQLVEAGLDRIIVSMDGLSQETYSAYRVGGSVEKVKAALRYLRQAKKHSPFANRRSPLIELQCLYLASNEQEWKEFKKQYKALGADKLTFKTAQFYNYGNGNPLMPRTHARYIQGADGRYRPKRKVQPFCRRLWLGSVVTAEGNVLPCCYDKEQRYTFGNILRDSFARLWQGAERRKFLQHIAQGKPYPICLNCQP